MASQENGQRWHAVEKQANGAGKSGLLVNNSLCNEKVPFVPHSKDQVTWYICGPTVYNSSHIGHARTYLSFDIIRRILEDYFGYNVFYVMNVTDVDDKIILRARREYLLAQYIGSATDANQVLADVKAALQSAMEKQKGKVDASKEAAAAEKNEKKKEPLLQQVAQEELKLQQLESAAAAVNDKVGPSAVAMGGLTGVRYLLGKEETEAGGAGESSKQGGEGVAGASANGAVKATNGSVPSDGQSAADSAAIEAAADALASSLDARLKDTVTDVSIFRQLAARYEKEFFDDMKALGVRPPHVLTRVTEYIDEIVKYVETIIEHGFAYAVNGSVYFDTKSFSTAGHTYGKLCPWSVGSAELASESEADFVSGEKKSKNDFALWKASKPGEPSWKSPWGEGRPGWHIECSAMASNVIGPHMDIHSGGIDLRFPHHDNELAQAEAFHNCNQWVNYFLHTGHLHIEGLKMSKSLKNFITIRQALAKYSPRQFRLLFLLQAWDKPMNYGDGAMADAVAKEKQLRNFFQTVQAETRSAEEGGVERWEEEEQKLHAAIVAAQQQVHERLQDNFDTAGAMAALFDLVSATNVYMNQALSRGKRPRSLLLQKAAKFVSRILQVFGILESSLDSFVMPSGTGEEGELASGKTKEDMALPFIQGFSKFRDDVRNAVRRNATKDELLSLTDRVRDYDMVDLGIRCEDRTAAASAASGSAGEGGASSEVKPGEAVPAVVKLDDPAVLRAERDERIRRAAAEAQRKAASKLAAKLKDLDRWQSASVPPGEALRKATDKYSAWDEQGIPTQDASGKELSNKAKKNAEKEFKKAEESHAKYLQKLTEDPDFLKALKEEVQKLQEQVAAATTATS